MTQLQEMVADRRPAKGVRIIDAHAHGGPYSLFFIPDNGPQAMIRVMDRCGVDQAFFSSHLGIQLDSTAGNRETARIVERYPNRFRGYIVINPWQDPEVELATWAEDARFSGIKIHPDQHHYPMTGPRYLPVWEFASRTGCPVLSHTWFGSDLDDFKHVAEVAEKYPTAPILVGHSGVLPAGFDKAVALARRYPALTLELCGSYNHGDLIEWMVGEVGSERIAYGSDFPFIDMRMSLGRVIFARLSDRDRAQILAGTMERLTAWRETRYGSEVMSPP